MQDLSGPIKFLIISIVPQNLSEQEAFINIKEVISLVETYGGAVEDILLQKREIHTKGSYIGLGKIEEAAEIIRTKDIDIVVFNALIKPGQLYELKTGFDTINANIKVWDKVDLILNIFSKHASTAEAKLQIEVASVRHMGPLLYGMGFEMSRQGGGIGTRGVGQTNTELMRLHWKEQIKKIQKKLEKLKLEREMQIERREKIGLKTISLIGYTNAGKTSLFNMLTGKKNLVENKLFATLESSVGKIYLPQQKKEVLISDTIGFIRDLPPELIEAFRSTLMESIHSDLLLHIIDISDSDMKRKIDVVERILSELKLNTKKTIYVFNKIDATSGLDFKAIEKEYSYFNPQFISASHGQGVEELILSIEKNLN